MIKVSSRMNIGSHLRKLETKKNEANLLRKVYKVGIVNTLKWDWEVKRAFWLVYLALYIVVF
jgi:hypothetical protein